MTPQARSARMVLAAIVCPDADHCADPKLARWAGAEPRLRHWPAVTWWPWLALSLALIALIWLALVVALLVVGRREEGRALAGFIPDCIVLVSRLMHDDRVPRGRKLLLAALVGYLALPFDLVPDFIPIAGQLDDVLVVALVLRRFLRSGGDRLVREHWPGPEQSLRLVLRVARI
jgi:uncharacterized membrane protein YkvA (DUF1232 family)